MSESVVTRLKFLEGYRFSVEFDRGDLPHLTMDEPKPIGDGAGPDSIRLLSAAVGHCLSSSLIYTLKMALVKVQNLQTTVNLTMERSETGRQTVKRIAVQMNLQIDEAYREYLADARELKYALEFFENFCTVTQSVRKGINVEVNLV